MTDIQLPSGWELRKSRAGKVFYKNTITGQTQWELPTDPVADPISLVSELLNNWETRKSRNGKTYYYNTKTGNSQWNFPGEKPAPDDETELSSVWERKKSHTTGQYYYYNTRTGKTTWTIPAEVTDGPNCRNIRGLKWVGNSCYMDSTLVSMFATPSKFTNDIITMNLETKQLPYSGKNYPCGKSAEEDLKNRKKVQQGLREVAESIRGSGSRIDYCSNLREAFRNCPDPENYFDNREKDAGEFLGYILSMFPVNVAHKRKITYGTNNMDEIPPSDALVETSNIVDKQASVIQWVDPFKLAQQNGEVYISEYIKQIQDSYPTAFDDPFEALGQKFIRRISIESIDESPYIIFSLKRISNFVSFITSRVVPDSSISLPNGKIFDLSAIVLYLDNHYTCTFRCGSVWYYFNDLGNSGEYTLREIGNYQKMLKINPSPITNGTLYFYVPKY